MLCWCAVIFLDPALVVALTCKNAMATTTEPISKTNNTIAQHKVHWQNQKRNRKHSGEQQTATAKPKAQRGSR